MAIRDPNIPQSDDEGLAADLIRLLTIVGPLGRLSVADFVVPVVSMGTVVTPTMNTLQPLFRSIDRFSEGIFISPISGTVHADTGALPEGAYDMQLHILNQQTTVITWEIQHRNAANNANVTQWGAVTGPNTGSGFMQTIAYEFAENERLRLVNLIAFGTVEFTTATIFARIRT